MAEAWFFIDSLDEAKLHRQTLGRALAKLGNGLGRALSRCHVVVSCRHSDWHDDDKETVERFAGKLIKHQSEPFAEAPLTSRRAAPRGLPSAAVHLLQLAPLNRDQIRIYAEQKAGILNGQPFIDALGRADLWGFAGRPLDVEWLAGFWTRKSKFGSLREMIEEDISDKLAEKRNPTLFPIPVSRKQARDAVEAIALALTMMGTECIPLPGSRNLVARDAFDIRALASDLNDESISSLLRLPLFDPATLGRVRFHHRTVREYLAATCLHRLHANGLAARELEELLFATVEGRTFARPGFQAIMAWLALRNPEVQRLAVKAAPEHLLDTGDPSGLSPDARREVLYAYANRYSGRTRTMHHFDRVGLERFGGEDLAEHFRKLLDPGRPEELREAILEMIERKKLASLADAALRVVQEDALSSRLRRSSIRALTAAGSIEEKRVLAGLMIPRVASDRGIADVLLEQLFPDVLTIDQVVTILETTPPHPNLSDGYSRVLDRLDAMCPPELRVDLLEKLSRLFDRLSFEKGKDLVKYLEWTPVMFALLDAALPTNNVAHIVPVCIRIWHEKRGADPLVGVGPDSDFADRPALRKMIFWNAVESSKDSHGRWPRSANDVWPYSLFSPAPIDAKWLRDGALCHAHVAARVLAFDGLVMLSRRGGSVDLDLDDVASRRIELARHLDRVRNPSATNGNWTAGPWRLRDLASQRRRDRQKLDELRQALPGIRAGTALPQLRRLCHLGLQESNGEWSHVPIVAQYGQEIADAAIGGMLRLWRVHEVEPAGARHAESTGIYSLMFAVRQGLEVSKLEDHELRKAIFYGALPEDSFPAWLDGCAERSPAAVHEVFEPLLRLEWDADHGNLLHRLASASGAMRACCGPAILTLLENRDPLDDECLSRALEALHPIEPHEKQILALCRARCVTSVGTPRRFAIWWRRWLSLDPSEAVAALRDTISAREPLPVADACVIACFATEDWEKLLAPLAGKTVDLIHLLHVVLKHVRIEEDGDTTRERHNARDCRWRLVAAVKETGSIEAVRALDALAARSWGEDFWSDWFRHSADECAMRAAIVAWPLRDVGQFMERAVLMPQNVGDLFRVVERVLADVQDHVERGDDSPRATYCRSNVQEVEFQVFLRAQMKARAQGRYSIAREDELADGTRPDLRVSFGDLGPVNIEIKIAELWSLTELEKALADQLVGQYMKDNKARHGVLLLVAARERKGWCLLPDKIDKFSGLLLHLENKATALRAARPEIEGLRVIGIDFH